MAVAPQAFQPDRPQAVASAIYTTIVIYSADNPDDSLLLPYAPPFDSKDASVKLTWSVSRSGGISRPRGRQERVYSLTMVLPGERDKDKPWVRNYTPPIDVVAKLHSWHAPIARQGVRLRFVCSARDVDSTVYISQIGVKHEGFGEMTLTLELTEWRVFTVRYDGEQLNTTGDARAAANQNQQNPPSGPDTPDQYAVQDGDTLWIIAQTELGDGNRWEEIYDLNRDAVGDDPDVLTIGTVLQLPSSAPGEADTNDPGQQDDSAGGE